MHPGIALRSAFTLLLLCAWEGCSSVPDSTHAPGPPDVHRSRDGRLQYVMPPGWFDVTADSQAAGHAVWIIRNDYHATLTIDEVRLDAAARAVLRNGGLEPLAELLMTLPSGERPVRRVTPPGTFERDGYVYCGYEVEVYETRDLLRVLLFRAEDRVYASTLVVPASVRESEAGQLAESQILFLESVTWISL